MKNIMVYIASAICALMLCSEAYSQSCQPRQCPLTYGSGASFTLDGQIVYEKDRGTFGTFETGQAAVDYEYQLMMQTISLFANCSGGSPIYDSANQSATLSMTCTTAYNPNPVQAVASVGVFAYSRPDLCETNKENFTTLDASGNCGDKGLNKGKPDFCGVGDPINHGYGNNYQIVMDYEGNGPFPLRFIRYYNSKDNAAWGNPKARSKNWRHSYERVLHPDFKSDGNIENVVANFPDGKVIRFVLNGAQWLPQGGQSHTLKAILNGSSTITGWMLKDENDNIETYSREGRLLQISDRAGRLQQFTYDSAGRVKTVTDHFGRALNFAYESAYNWDVLKSITTPDGKTIQYVHGYNTTTVIYQDQKERKYFYDEDGLGSTADINLLTGIEDENGKRVATFKYDNFARAFHYSSANGVDAINIVFNSDGTRVVTDAIGASRTYGFTTVNGVLKGGWQSQPAGSGCSAASKSNTYDVNGNLDTQTDFNNNVTKFNYDLARNLETSRIEGYGTLQARTITTQWHETFRLPIRIAEPKKLTTYVYNGQNDGGGVVACAPSTALVDGKPIAVLCKMTEQATTDEDGANGFTAVTTGTPRTWSYTYNSTGQVLTIDGPRTDVADTTTYAYDTSTGNLLTITNALGQITTLSNYDANGRVGKIVNPKGITTDLTYWPRGWLKQRKVTGSGNTLIETVDYVYDGVGQLTQVTLPDRVITYTYDDAHRLTDIADNAGNTVHYTLDNMGNRTKEEVKDSSGTLARQITRVYDALNRLQDITGAAQ